VPDVAFVPDHPPLAVQVDILEPDQERAEAEPTITEVGLAVRVRDGVVGGGGGVPPPLRAYWVAANTAERLAPLPVASAEARSGLKVLVG